MNYDAVKESKLVYTGLQLFPESLRTHLLADTSFCEKHNIATDAEISFGNKTVSFSRKALFNGIRIVFDGSNELVVADINGLPWKLSVSPNNITNISITSSEDSFSNDSFWPLVSDLSVRSEIFEREARIREFRPTDCERWRKILTQKCLNDDIVRDITSDLELTPSYIEESLESEFNSGSSKVKNLVPDDLLYYERFIGISSYSKDIKSYASNELNLYFEQKAGAALSATNLLLCSHQAISLAIAKRITDPGQFLILAKKALESGDPTSLIACFEIGIYKFISEHQDALQEIFERLCDPSILANFTLLSAMTTFVDGELSRLGTFSTVCPFYRRLASLSQASLITRAAIKSNSKFEDIENWAMKERGLIFFSQIFIDLRKEPRWLPSYVSPEQLRDETYGRIYNICQAKPDIPFCTKVLAYLSSKSLTPISAFLPGPLEGNTSPEALPEELSKQLEIDMDKPASHASFRALINSAQFWALNDRHVELAVKVLENAQHQLKETTETESLFQTLNGLAKVAAIVRSKKLAASVMILSRIYRRYLNVNSAPENIVGIGLVAAAAFEDKNEWAEYVGQWFTELAYLSLDKRATTTLYSMLEQLCILEPYLYYTCGRPLEILKCLDSK